jgi:hypothetical protein
MRKSVSPGEAAAAIEEKGCGQIIRLKARSANQRLITRPTYPSFWSAERDRQIFELSW